MSKDIRVEFYITVLQQPKNCVRKRNSQADYDIRACRTWSWILVGLLEAQRVRSERTHQLRKPSLRMAPSAQRKDKFQANEPVLRIYWLPFHNICRMQ